MTTTFGRGIAMVFSLVAAVLHFASPAGNPCCDQYDLTRVSEVLEKIAEEHRSALDEAGFVTLEEWPDLWQVYNGYAFEPGQDHLFLFHSELPPSKAWDIVKDYEKFNTYPDTTVVSMTKIESDRARPCEIPLRNESKVPGVAGVFTGSTVQYTITSVCEKQRIVMWRTDRERDNSTDNNNGFWAVVETEDGGSVGAYYSALSLRFFEGIARDIQRKMAEAVHAEWKRMAELSEAREE